MSRLYTIKEAAEALGITYDTLHHYVSQGRITRSGTEPGKARPCFTDADLDAFRGSRRPFRRSDEEWAEISRRYHAGETAAALAKEFSLAEKAILAKVGSRRSYLTREVWEEILRRKKSGETGKALAQEFGISASRVNARARKAG